MNLEKEAPLLTILSRLRYWFVVTAPGQRISCQASLHHPKLLRAVLRISLASPCHRLQAGYIPFRDLQDLRTGPTSLEYQQKWCAGQNLPQIIAYQRSPILAGKSWERDFQKSSCSWLAPLANAPSLPLWQCAFAVAPAESALRCCGTFGDAARERALLEAARHNPCRQKSRRNASS
jgi:hypothetical protein